MKNFVGSFFPFLITILYALILPIAASNTASDDIKN